MFPSSFRDEGGAATVFQQEVCDLLEVFRCIPLRSIQITLIIQSPPSCKTTHQSHPFFL